MSVRISSVVINTGPDQQVFRVDPEADIPQSVVIAFADGQKLTVNADGSLGLHDGRTVVIDSDGAIQVTGRKATADDGKYDVTIGRGARAVQVGHGNTQVTSFKD